MKKYELNIGCLVKLKGIRGIFTVKDMFKSCTTVVAVGSKGSYRLVSNEAVKPIIGYNGEIAQFSSLKVKVNR